MPFLSAHIIYVLPLFTKKKINEKKREKRIVNNKKKKEQHCWLVKDPGFRRVKSAWTFFLLPKTHFTLQTRK